LAVLGSLNGVLANSHMNEATEALAGACAIQVDGPDSCQHAKPGQWAAAQSHADSIATWRSVRAVSYVGAGVGLVGIVTGAAMLITAERVSTVAASNPRFVITPQQFTVLVQRAF
jgi:hypothetical protein